MMMRKITPVKFEKSGKLKYLGEQKSINGRFSVKVSCECGTVKFMSKHYFNSGKAKSCGCSRRSIGKPNSETNLYHVWSSIKARCRNENHKSYERYGGRGITLHPDWLKDFELFKSWSLENGYEEGLSIDRIENDDGYHPENCRWTDQTTQNRNKSNVIWIEHEGEMKRLVDWAEELDIKPSVLHDRHRAGWETKDILDPNIRKSRVGEKIYYNGESHTISEWAEITGISQKAISDRLIRGFTVERALTQPLQKRKRKDV